MGLNLFTGGADVAYRCLRAFFFLFALSICASLLLYDFVSFYYERSFSLPFFALLAIGLLLLIGIICFPFNQLKSKNAGTKEKYDAYVYAISIVLLVAHLIAAYQTRFLGSWDSGGLYTAAWNVAHGWNGIPFAPEGWNDYFTKDLLDRYFSTYPNNGFLVALMIATMRALSFAGINEFGAPLLIFTCLNSFLYMISGILLHKVLKAHCPSAISFLGFLFFVALVGLSPWFLVAYSDSLTIVVPITICWLVKKAEEQNGRYACPCFGAMVFIGLIGYFIKPQIIFIMLAAFLAYACPRIIQAWKTKHLRGFARIAIAVSVGLIAAFVIKGTADHIVDNSFNIDKNQSFSAAHFFMMGLNDETNGGFCEDDVSFSQSFSNTAERNAADISRALERISNKGAYGIAIHVLKKQDALWGDSSFAWSQEGGLRGTYAIMLKDSVSPFSAYLTADFETDGQVTSTLYGTIIQIVWLIVVLSLPTTLKLDGNRRFITMLMIAILCLGIFEICFEVRSRYLFTYVPIIILLACIALNGARLHRRVNSTS